jgi:MFS family permease
LVDSPHRAASHPSSFHYGWVIVAAGAVISAIATSALYSFGVFLEPVSRDMGWSRGEFSLAYALAFVTSAFASFGAGWLNDKLGSRFTLMVSSALLALGLALSAGVSELWQFYLYYGLLFGAASTPYVVVLHTTIGLWFRRRLGLAMGVVTMSLGVGPLLFAPLGTYMIQTSGWRATFLLMGIFGGFLLLVCSWFVRSKPADMGLAAYGQGVEGSAGAGVAPLHQAAFYREDQPNFFRYAMTTQPFILLLIIHFVGCVGHSLPLAHMVAMAIDAGISAMLASTVLGLVMGFSIVGRFVIAILADRWGGKVAFILVLFAQSSSILILLFANEIWLFYLFALAFGLGYGGELVVFPIINRQYYGSATIGTVYGAQMMAASFGMGLGGYLGGVLYDLMGNYTGAILVASLMSFLGLLVALRLVPPLSKPALEGASA